MSDYVDISSRYYKFIVFNYLTHKGIRIVPRSVTLSEFVQKNRILNDVLIPGAKRNMPNVNTECRLFSEVGRHLFLNLLQLFKDLFESNLCIVSLKADDMLILVDERNVVKFRQGLRYVAASEQMINKNFAMLAGIIDNTVLLGYEGWVGEIEDLLCLLRVDGCKNRDLIFSSTCLFDLCDRITVFTRAHSYLLTRIKEYNPVHYEEILSELVFRYDWEDPVKDNDHLLECYNARKTDNQKKVKAMKQARVLSSQGGNQQSNGLIIGPPSHGNPSRGQSTAPPKRASTSKTHHQLNKGKAPAAPPPPLPTQQHKKPFVQKYNLPGCDLREEVMAFYRNVGTHGMDRSMKKLREVYGLPGLNVMLLSLLPHLASSLMRALHTRGYLSLVDLPRLLK